MRKLSEIAGEIRADWKNVNYTAEPYLSALETLGDIKENYYYDSGKSVVRYFLANAQTWRGDNARRIKAELKKMVGTG